MHGAAVFVEQLQAPFVVDVDPVPRHLDADGHGLGPGPDDGCPAPQHEELAVVSEIIVERMASMLVSCQPPPDPIHD